MITSHVDDSDFQEQIRAALVGRSITATKDELLILSDGTRLYVTPNDGCICGSGEYDLISLNHVQNVITGVEVSTSRDRHWEGEREFSISVYAEGVPGAQALAKIEGYDGNGFYGTGFTITVQEAEEDAE